MTYIEAEKFCFRHRCAVCGNVPSKYIAANGEYEVRCQKEHKGFTRLKGYTQTYREGGNLPVYIANVLEKKERSEMAEMEQKIGTGLPALLETQLEPKRVKDSLDKIKELQKLVMKKGVDYGIFPGTKAMSLFKPGAEKLRLAFWLTAIPIPLEKVEDWDKGFFFYRYQYEISSADGSAKIAVVRSCHSKEDKYRWRWVLEKELPTGINKDELRQKIDQYKRVWFRIENDDPYSLQNTIEAMAQKRCFVAGVLMITGASAIFSEEDVEPKAKEDATSKPATIEVAKQPPTEPEKEAKPQQPVKPYPITEAQSKKIDASADKMGYTVPERIALMKAKFGVENKKDLTMEQASKLIEALEAGETIKAPEG